MTIAFRNSGQIDLQLVATFGCSVKETKNPIGFFGTGLKYALAVLLRTNHKIDLQVGLEVISVHTRELTLRGKSFAGVYAGDTYLGFTTELGKNWEPWMAYRELYCNAMDEKDSRIWRAEGPVEPMANTTTFLISGEEIVKQHNEREKFLLLTPPTHRLGDTLELTNKPSAGLFYKGVRVANWKTPALFTYNILAPLCLTEDRTLADHYTANQIMCRALITHAPAHILRTILTAPVSRKEYGFDFDWHSISMTETFANICAELESDSAGSMNRSALNFYHRNLGRNGIAPKEVPMSMVEQKTLEKALAFCARLGYPIKGSYPIKLAESLGTNVFALAERSTNTIFLTRKGFIDGGTKGIASTLIEEYLHLKMGLDDCTRNMQTHLFNKIISLGEELQQEPL